MKIGDIVFFSGHEPEYGIVTDTFGSFHWAYWSEQEQKLTFELRGDCYHFIGPSVLGKWK